MIEDNIWYRYKSYSLEELNSYNGVIKFGDISIHSMIRNSRVIQLMIMSYRNNFENGLYRENNKEVISTSNKIIIPFIAKRLLNEQHINGIFNIVNGKIKNRW